MRRAPARKIGQTILAQVVILALRLTVVSSNVLQSRQPTLALGIVHWVRRQMLIVVTNIPAKVDGLSGRAQG